MLNFQRISSFLAIFLALALVLGAPAPANAAPEKHAGILDVYVADYPTKAKMKYFLKRSDGKRFELRFKGKAPTTLRTGMKVRVRGDRKKNVLQLSGTSSVQSLSGASVAALTGARRAVALLVNFSDSNLTCSNSSIQSLMFGSTLSVDKEYQETSRGAVSFPGDTDGNGTPDVFGPFTISHTVASGSCDYSSWASAADSAATAAGVNLSLYQHKIYVLPSNTPCSWAGLGNLGCGSSCRAWVKSCGTKDVYVHELGHNIGLHHASTDTNNDGTTDSEYGDTSCPMGYGGIGWRHFNAPHQTQMGWLDSANIIDVSGPGSYVLEAVESPLAVPKVLRISRPSSSQKYYVSFRAPIGSHSVNLPTAYRYKTNIHKFSGSGYSYYVAGLSDGQTFTDAAQALTVKQVSYTTGTGSSQAQVEISMTCSPAVPTISVSPAKFVAGTPQAASFMLTLVNRDTFCGSSTFALAAQAPVGWVAALDSTSISLAAGQSASTALRVTAPSGAAQGTYTIPVSVTDSSGAHQALQISVQYVLDQTPPVAITNLTVSAGRKNQVALSWTEPMDIGGAGVKEYRVYRNGSLRTTTFNTNYTDSVTSGASYSYVVHSVDNAGNVSSASNIANITIGGGGGGGGGKGGKK